MKRFYTHPGSATRPVYKLVFDKKTHELELAKVGEENFQDYIQSFAESTDIQVIARRINNGELNLLSSDVGQYGDFTNLPNSLMQAMQIQLNAQAMFESLPEDIQKKFGSASEYFRSAGSFEWLENMGYKVSDDKEVNSDEQE